MKRWLDGEDQQTSGCSDMQAQDPLPTIGSPPTEAISPALLSGLSLMQSFAVQGSLNDRQNHAEFNEHVVENKMVNFEITDLIRMLKKIILEIGNSSEEGHAGLDICFGIGKAGIKK